ncbi:MAG: methyltransferase domain-containing protein [Verrucomicrobiales bacterium]
MIEPREKPEPAAVARHYDALDPFYREVWGRDLHHGYWKTGRETVAEAVGNLTAAAADLARVASGDRVCDIGCGYGGTSLWLAEHRGADVTGYTLSRHQAESAASAAARLPGSLPRPRFLCRDWLENGLPDGSADAVLSIECFSHVDDKAAFFREIARVLKPGGRVGMTAWLARERPRPWEVRHLLEPICREGRLAGLVDLSELREFAESAGLVVDDLRDIGPRVGKTWRVIVKRLAVKLATRPDYRAYLRDERNGDRVFALTVLRLAAAYLTRSMGYGLLGARRPQ